ncbi:exo-alpha-sialidase [Streptomyces sp. NPDC057877]|uniref:exo-alpha-sialidase n=1 Tax=Streptomyces sp. NPDC057877 TaxID=3346269 RepID=UPI0036CC8ACB
MRRPALKGRSHRPSSRRVRPRATLTTATLTAAAVTAAAAFLPSAAQARPTAQADLAAHARPAAPAAPFDHQVLFRADRDPGGYACFRIPAIVRTNDNTLLAFAEGRVLNCGDATDIDIVLKRSTDGGRTWSPLQVVNDGNGDTHGNPAPVVDRETGRIILAQTYNTGRPDSAHCTIPCDRAPWLQYSDDDGRTWSKPRDLSAELLPANWNSWFATGPVHGIQLTRGAHAGRLVLGVNAETFSDGRVTTNHAALVISDDGGEHWRIGATDSYPVASDGSFRQKPSEVTPTELADGSLLVSSRDEEGTDLGHRSQTLSRDGGESFTTPFQGLPDLYTPEVQGALLSLDDRVLLAAPGDPDRRRTMMLRSSYDGGRTWDSVDRGTVIGHDWAGYSDLVDVDSETVGLMYEGGTVDARDEIRFVRVTESQLAPRRDPDPTTADHGLLAPRATVLGGAAPTPGVVGEALSFDGKDDAVRLPYRSELALGSGDFTTSLWFRHTADRGEQPLLWIGGIGVSQPQVWLRGDPANGLLRGLITTREGARTVRTAYVDANGAYNDGRWHHVVLRRGGGKLTLFLDGEAVGSTADVAGSVSRNSPFGVHIGQRMDSRAFFTGAIDDVRVWNRALSDGEIGTMRGTGTGPALGTLTWLPMDQVSTSG